MSNPYLSHTAESFYDLQVQSGLQPSTSASNFFLAFPDQDWSRPLEYYNPGYHDHTNIAAGILATPVAPKKSTMEMISAGLFLVLSRYISLRDLVKLGSTSRTMWYQCHSQPKIWMRQLALICRTQALAPGLILEPWRFTNERSITCVQFAHLCQWPSKFIHAIRKPSKDFVFFRRSIQIPVSMLDAPDAPTSTRTRTRNKRKRGDAAAQPTESTLNLQLLPGGRHVVTADHEKVHVYDLGLRHTLDWSPLASVNLELRTEFKPRGRPRVEVYNYSTAGCDRFRILVIHDNDIDKWSISAFEVGLRESQVHAVQTLLTVYGRKTCGRLLYAVRDDFIATLSGSTLRVWHVLGEGSTLSWDIGNLHTEAKLLTIAVSPFTVLIIHSGGVLGWIIPQSYLLSLESGSNTPYRPETPDIVYPLLFTEHILNTWKHRRSTRDVVTIGRTTWESLLPMWHDYDTPLFEGRSTPQFMFEVKTKLQVNGLERLFRWRYSYFLPCVGNPNGALTSTYHYEVPNQWDEGFRYIGVNDNYHLLAGYSTLHQTAGIVATPMTVYNAPRPGHLPPPHQDMFWAVLFKTQEAVEKIVKTMTMCPLTGRICYETAPYKIDAIDYFCTRAQS